MAVTFKNETLAKHSQLAGSIKNNLVVENTTIKEQESHKAYYENLPEGIQKETVETIAGYNQSYVAAAHVAVGEIAADEFNKNKELERLDAQLGFFGKKDSIEMTVHREKTYRNNFAETEEDKQLKKHLVVTASVKSSGHGLKPIREAMSEEFANSFAK